MIFVTVAALKKEFLSFKCDFFSFAIFQFCDFVVLCFVFQFTVRYDIYMSFHCIGYRPGVDREREKRISI